jgi:hypothetical protein
MNENQHHHGARRVAVLAAAVGTALVTAACAGNSSTSVGVSGSASPSTAYQKELAYAQCMRTHGVPNAPDPGPSGLTTAPPTGLSPSSPVVQAANKICGKLAPALPAGAAAQQDAQQELRFVQCMRTHGVPNMPDPRPGGGITITLPNGTRLNPNAPQFQKAQEECQHLMTRPGGSGTAGG